MSVIHVKSCYERLGAMYGLDVASELLTVVNESIKQSICLCNKCKNALQMRKVPPGSQFKTK